VSRQRWDELYGHDQLARERRAARVFQGFQEARVQFPPTFKVRFQSLFSEEFIFLCFAHSPSSTFPAVITGVMCLHAIARLSCSPIACGLGAQSSVEPRCVAYVMHFSMTSARLGLILLKSSEYRPGQTGYSSGRDNGCRFSP